MDWTGGVRRRYARGRGNSTIQKQKAHFARARAAKQDSKPSQNKAWPNNSSQASRSARRSRSRASQCRNDPPVSSKYQRSQPSFRGRPALMKSPKARQTSAAEVDGPAQSIIYISSPAASSSDISTVPPQNVRKQQCVPQQTSANNDAEEEQRLLLANRRRMLARSDWLGLTASRTAKMHYGSVHDKDVIGRRRKIKRSTSKSNDKPMLQSLSPNHQSAFLAPERTLHQSLRPEDIVIKIGTDALKSQTQVSRLTRTPEGERAARPSTGLTLLSEEPMLLGYVEDEDGLDKLEENFETVKPSGTTAIDTLACFAGSTFTQTTPAFPMMRQSPPQTTGFPTQQKPVSYQLRDLDAAIGHEGSIIEDSVNCPRHSHVSQRPLKALCDELRLSRPLDQDVAHFAKPSENEEPREISDIDVYDYERRILQVTYRKNMNLSPSSARSCNVDSVIPVTGTTAFVFDREARVSSTGCVTDNPPPTIGDPILGTATQGLADILSHSPEAFQPLSNSSKNIQRFANCYNEKSKTNATDEGDVAAAKAADWRRFIVGSPHSSHEPSPAPASFWSCSDESPLMPGSPDVSSAFTVSGLGTSAKATQGNMHSMFDDSATMNSRATSENEVDVMSETHDTSLVCNANTSSNDSNELNVEQDNFHAPPRKVLEPRRFKKRVKRQLTQAARKANRFLPFKSKNGTTASELFIYDIPDSD